MRILDAHLMEDKMDEAVTHYINSHPGGEGVHVDANGLSLQDDSGRVVTVMHQSYSSHLTRQVSSSDVAGSGQWSEELLDADGRLAALVAHLARSHHQVSHHKVALPREVDSAMLDTPLRLFNGHSLESQQSGIDVEVPPLTPLPPLQEMKRCQDTNWFTKTKATLKENGMLSDSDVLELGASASPAQSKHSKKSLPHKKRISRKLKRNNGNCTPQQDVVVLNCSEEVHHEEILPDSLVSVPHPDHMPQETHIAHEVRAILICQLCGEFYGEEQLKFYQHLKQHYEPHGTIIIENPVPDLTMDKMNSTCIVDNVASLPDSIVELSLEGSVPKGMYHMDKHILYSSADRALYTSNKVQYTMACMDKDPVVPTSEADKLYDTLDKLEMYSCGKCNKSFRKQKHCEAHIKEAHTNKLEDMGEFSEPEDLMEGIHVAVEEGTEPYETLLPHLTVDNGHVHQEHVRHWYLRGGEGTPPCGGPAGYCPVCPRPPASSPHAHLKEEEIQRIFETEVPTEPNFADNIIPENELPQPQQPTQEITTTTAAAVTPAPAVNSTNDSDKKKVKKFECQDCNRVFHHRNSLLYHALSHSGKQETCKECNKRFYTAAALKVHKRVHNGDRPYKCEQCGREFRQWSDLKYHKVSLHSDQKHFKCEFCGKEFARKYSLNVHRRIHTGEKNYKCEYCTKTFRASSYRLSHMRTHTGDKPYKCSVCEKCFRVAGDLRRHMNVHEKVRNRLEQPPKSGPKDKLKKPKDEPKDKQKDPINIEPPTKIKKIATASTARQPVSVLKNLAAKKTKPTKNIQVKKEIDIDTPNVTITNNKPENYKSNNYNNEAYDTRQEYSKFKEVYAEPSTYTKDQLPNHNQMYANEQILIYKDGEQRYATYKESEHRYKEERPIYKGDRQTHKEDVIVVSKDGQRHLSYKESESHKEDEQRHHKETERHITYKDNDQKNYRSAEIRNLLYKDTNHKDDPKELAILKPMYRTISNEIIEKSTVNREESSNTDGKLQVFTQIEKSSDTGATLADVRALERARGEPSEENGFLERLTFLYNVPAV